MAKVPDHLASKPSNMVCRQFTTEGGELQNPSCNAILTVPAGAVPPGETWTVSVKTLANNLGATMWGLDKGDLLCPMVECKVEPHREFKKPVILSLPLYKPPQDTSNINVSYSIKDTFQDVSSDNEMSYEFNEDFLHIKTKHFTKFIVSKGKHVDISELRLTLAASRMHNMVGQGFIILTLMALARSKDSPSLKELERQGLLSCPKDTEEIGIQQVVFDHNQSVLQFPVINIGLHITPGADWEIPYQNAEKNVAGKDVLLLDKFQNIGSFVLISRAGAKQVEFRMEVACRFRETGIAPLIHNFSMIYPAEKQPMTYSERTTMAKYVLQQGVCGGKKTVCKSRVVLMGHYRAGKTSLKKCLLKQKFDAEYKQTDSIDADPSEARVDVTKTNEWEIHEGGNDYAVFAMRYVADKMWDDGLAKQRTDERMAQQWRDKQLEYPSDERQLPAEEAVWAITAAAVMTTRKDNSASIQVELFFWDFGGQTLYYNTHMTFLTHRSVYLLVMDLTKALTDTVPTWRLDENGKTVLDQSCPKSVADFLDYWCSCVHTFVPPEDCPEGATKGQVATPAIVIVCTHMDELKEEEAEEHVKHYVQQIREYIADKSYFNHINEDIFTLSSKDPDERVVQQLRDKIFSLARDQSYDLPLPWVKFKDILIKKTPRGNPNIPRKSWVEASDAAWEVGWYAGSDVIVDLAATLKFFHGVGDIVFFDEDELKNFIITDPQWVIDQFKKVITIPRYRPHFKDSGRHWKTLYSTGVLHEAVLKNVWESEVRDELIALMKKFALLCDITASELVDLALVHDDIASEDVQHKRFLVPSLIPPRDLPSSGKAVLPVFLRPSGNFLPIGLTSRLIAGLINEDRWTLVGIAKDAAVFLPQGREDSIISVCIKGTGTEIEVCGKELDDGIQGCDFSIVLNTVWNRLHAITCSICPQRQFTMGIRCQECHDRGEKVILEIWRKEENYCKPLYCAHHGGNSKTLPYSCWFCKRSTEPSNNPTIDVKAANADNKLTYAQIDYLLTKHTPALMKRFKLSEMVIARLRKDHVIDDDTKDQLAAKGITPHEKTGIILETVRAKGETAFLDFCHVLCQPDIGQEHLVTKVMGLTEDYIDSQRGACST